MDMTVPMVLMLQLGGNALVFYGLYLYCRDFAFAPKTQTNEEEADQSLDDEIKILTRQLKRM